MLEKELSELGHNWSGESIEKLAKGRQGLGVILLLPCVPNLA